MSEIELKRCPFCGGKGKLTKSLNGQINIVVCENVPCVFFMFRYMKYSEWQNRPIEDALCSAISAVGKELSETKGSLGLQHSCMERARKIWMEKHPEDDSWPDGAKNISWLFDRLKAVEQERDMAVESMDNDEKRMSDLEGTINVLEAELRKWNDWPKEYDVLKDLRIQSNQNSLAAKQAYINGLEFELKHTQDSLRKMNELQERKI
jgi:flagellar biosynthesis chaperone FliJ